MASNFQFLAEEKQFEGLYHVAVVAESSYNFQPQDPDTTIMLTRKALEYAVKWIYTYDSAIDAKSEKINIERDPLSKLISIKTFHDIVGKDIYKSIDFLRILGNRSAHSFNNKTTLKEAEVALENLFIVCDFIYYCYSKESKYLNNTFDIKIIKNTLPPQKEIIDEKTPLANVSEKEQADHTKTRINKKETFTPKSLNLLEKETRKVYIDTMLREAGWKEGINWINEYEVEDYKYSKTGRGEIDYTLLDKEGRPIAIIEAKREDRYHEAGSEQAREYSIALEKKFGIKPVIFLSNGFNFTIWQEGYYQPREIYGFYSEEDLLKTANILENRKDISNVETRPEIADRYYQIQAVKSICSAFTEHRRKALLVMATGCGKTRTVLSLVDVLSRYGWVKNVLFLADRVSLVKQAYNAAVNMQDYLKINLCNISDEENSAKIDYSMPFIFSTYQTMRNLLNDSSNNPYSVGHFDLIILDEAHRSIYNKYQDIFKYFDSMLVGLTATPKNEVGRNTYEIFDLENRTPTYGYELEQAVKDGYLVNYQVANYKLDILNRGIHYKDLSPEEKEEYEELFADDDGNVPESIDENHINRTIFNKDTIKKALQILLKQGLYINEGNTLGKTIIFARNHKHAVLILEIFRKTFPNLLDYCLLIDNYVEYHSSLVHQFATGQHKARIAISVDMLDTGVDIPDCLNLVFFKPVKSYSKFIQMIGRGTRLWQNPVNGEKKTHFLIFDLCNNFEYFGEEENRRDNDSSPKSIMAKLFELKLDLCLFMQNRKEHEEIYNIYKNNVHNTIKSLPENDISVRQNIKLIKEYSKDNALNDLTSSKVTSLSEKLAPCIPMMQDNIKSLKFDELMYNIMIANLRQQNSIRYINQLNIIADKLLESKLPVVNKHKDLLEEIVNGKITQQTSIKELENIRQILRPLVIYIDGTTKEIYLTNFEDKILVTEAAESEPVINTRYLENYKKKVEQELKKRCTSGVINKLYTNKKLSKADIRDLERILWQDLGTEAQYRQAAGQMPVTEFILSVTGLDNDVVLERFSKYINENNYNHHQIEFIKQLIENIRRNGFIKDKSILLKAPFSNYGGISKLFNDNEINEIIEIIDSFEVVG